jgi:hypothetical protein
VVYEDLDLMFFIRFSSSITSSHTFMSTSNLSNALMILFMQDIRSSKITSATTWSKYNLCCTD